MNMYQLTSVKCLVVSVAARAREGSGGSGAKQCFTITELCGKWRSAGSVD